MIEKRSQKRGKTVKVTFSVPVEWLPTPVAVVGDFNDWDPGVNPMRKRGGHWRTAVEFEAGRRYAFRYLDVDGRWHDESAADDIEVSEHGTANCILDLTLPEGD